MLVNPAQKEIVKANKKIIPLRQVPEEFEPAKESLNDIIESPADRTYRLRKQLARAKPSRQSMSKARRHLLFINPGTEKIQLVRYSKTVAKVLSPRGSRGKV